MTKLLVGATYERDFFAAVIAAIFSAANCSA